MSHRDKEKITAVTPSKPNFEHVGLGESVVDLLRFTLVIVLMSPSVIVREALV
jgi:hypothetical protein